MDQAGGPDAPSWIATIDHVGSGGDGVILRDGAGPVHVARCLPGETVAVRLQMLSGARLAQGHAELIDVVTPSPERVAAPCPHFTQGCGGCALQHWDDAAYAAWKRGLVVAALRRAGFEAGPVGALVRTPARARRRMDFAVRRGPEGVAFGLHRAHGADIVNLHVCHVLAPALARLIDPLRGLLSGLGALRRDGSVLANLVDDGADLLIRTDGPLAATDRSKLAAFADAYRVLRVSWAVGNTAPETAALLSRPMIRFGGTTVAPPPGAFLQASAEGEAAIVSAVLDGLPVGLGGRAFAVELFSGVGTLSFPVAARLRVLAFEGDAEAVDAVRRAQSGSRVEVMQRDLARQPLSAKQVRGAAVVILDPPYGGAAGQCGLIAASGVKRIIYVSCNPGALARDAALLATAGYALVRAVPIDQFVWSAQVECVATFER